MFYRRFPWPQALGDDLDPRDFSKPNMPNGDSYARGKHGGVDHAHEGQRVIAGRAGKVIARGGDVWGPSYGKQVLIAHRWRGRRWFTFHAHLAQIAVKVGARVRASTLIGHVGDTGNTFGAHDHHELHRSRHWRRRLRDPYPQLVKRQRRERGER